MFTDDVDIWGLFSPLWGDPGDFLTLAEREAYERLGPERWWRWARAGYASMIEEEI